MIVVTGVTGQLGAAFSRLDPGARGVSRADLDLARPSDIGSVLDRLSPTVLINCAAYTAVDRAETEEDLATTINGEAVGVMARWTFDRGIPFVTFSTDYVFAGDADRAYVESDTPAPINAYGRSKLAGEHATAEANPNALIVRTSWVVSGTHPNFIATMLRLIAQGGPVRVVDDQVGRPTMVDDLAHAVSNALTSGVTGVLHLTNSGEPVSWCGLAAETARLAGAEADVVVPISTAEYPTPARRPANSVLASERLSTIGLNELPDWRASLPPVVASLRSR